MQPLQTQKCPHCGEFFSVYHILIHKMKCRTSIKQINKESDKKFKQVHLRNKKTKIKKIPKKKNPNQTIEVKRLKKPNILKTDSKSYTNIYSKRTEKKLQKNQSKQKIFSKESKKIKKSRSKIQKLNTKIYIKKKIPKKRVNKLQQIMSEPRIPKKKCKKCNKIVSINEFQKHVSECNYKRCEYCSDYFPGDIFLQHKR